MDYSGTSQSHCIRLYRRRRVMHAMTAQFKFRAGWRGIGFGNGVAVHCTFCTRKPALGSAMDHLMLGMSWGVIRGRISFSEGVM